MPKEKRAEDLNRIRVNIQLDREVLKNIDEYSRFNGLTRAGAISVLCMQTIQQNKVMELMNGFDEKMKKLFEMQTMEKDKD